MNNKEIFCDENIKLKTIEGADGFIEYDLYPFTMDGQALDLNFDVITLQPERLTINFERMPSLLHEHAKAFLSGNAAKLSNVSLFNRFNLIVRIFKCIESSSIETAAEDIENEVRKFMRLSERSSEKSMLRSFYGWCVDNETPFFDEDFYDLYLDTLVFGADTGKGIDVLTRIPNRGPLTLSEAKKFREVLKNINLDDLSTSELQGLVSLKLGQVLGIRDVQVTKLKFKHFGCNSDGAYFIDVPRAKQRGKRKKNITKRRPITTSAAELIIKLKARYEEFVDISSEWPIITSFKNRKREPLKMNVTAEQFRNRRVLIEKKMDLPFRVTNRRLRKSFCVELISKGVPLITVAELMDHSDLQQLDVYYMQTHHIAKKLDQVLREEAKEVLDIFAGKFIKSSEETKSGQAIFAPIARKLHKIGSCSSEKPCMLSPPLSCYGCSSLEAFIDVDHSAVVDSLVDETKKVFGEQHSLEILKNEEFLSAAMFVEKFKEVA